jgi:hypothetical protein
MRNATATHTSDFRLQDCKHDRLRAALEFHPRGAVAKTATPSPTSVARPRAKSAHKGLLGGAAAMLGLAASWFMMASFTSVDFSQYETDTSTPQIVRPAGSVSSAPVFPS